MFQRARSEEQREARRQAILGAAAAMLAEMPVAEVTLNELSRRAGLAKSNVLRYFETREEVFLSELPADVRDQLRTFSGTARKSLPLTRQEAALWHEFVITAFRTTVICVVAALPTVPRNQLKVWKSLEMPSHSGLILPWLFCPCRTLTGVGRL